VPKRANLEYRSQLLRVASVTLSVEFDAVCQRRSGFVRIEEHMVQVFEKLTNAEMVSLSVVELAARFGCSRRHLNRLFHQYFGISVSALKMEMRLLKAMTLLRNPDAKVTNVAEDCGFNHLGLFTSCFKRRFGCSPGRWRELASHTQAPSIAPANGDGTCQLRMIGLCPWTGDASVRHLSPLQEAPVGVDGGAERLHPLPAGLVRGRQPTPATLARPWSSSENVPKV
jgi:AraC-like DNA-binding protein